VCQLCKSCGLCPTLIVQYGIGGRDGEWSVLCLGTRGSVICQVILWQ